MRFSRSPIDAQVRQVLGIGADERVLAWGVGEQENADTSYVVATNAGLYEQRSNTFIPWASVVKGTWEQPEFVLTVEGPEGVQRVRMHVAQARDLPAVVRDRVTDTVVVSEHVDLGEDRGAQLVARRGPGGGVEDISWSVVFDAGLDSRDEGLRAAADQALRDLRASLGI
ncbi:MAG TPA: hypothetical protein VGP37_03755 [Candidatus Nanopelagicales bacterium]|nr:hypothetical protein [Candidatus Nanopelagicales bacterium]